MMTMQLSLTTMKTVTACEQALHLNDIDRSNARVARERRHGRKVRGRHEAPTRNRDVATSR